MINMDMQELLLYVDFDSLGVYIGLVYLNNMVVLCLGIFTVPVLIYIPSNTVSGPFFYIITSMYICFVFLIVAFRLKSQSNSDLHFTND